MRRMNRKKFMKILMNVKKQERDFKLSLNVCVTKLKARNDMMRRKVLSSRCGKFNFPSLMLSCVHLTHILSPYLFLH